MDEIETCRLLLRELAGSGAGDFFRPTPTAVDVAQVLESVLV